jgi:uroporphyrinogen-III decarboxylase
MDMNAYCLGHLSGKGDPLSAVLSGGVIAAFPDNFITEAAAFGAETGTTKNGFPITGYVWTEPAMLTALPMLDETEAVKAVLEAIETSPRDKTTLLKVNGPYSILASLVEPALFYRWLRKNKKEIHAALGTITRGLSSYMIKALQKGATILSLADPYADTKTLGKERYAEFAAHYLVSLLEIILNRKEQLSGVMHVCPYNSLALEELKLVTASSLRVEYSHETYVEVIDSYHKSSRKDRVLLAGHQCIYTGNTGKIIVLNIQSGRDQQHEL